MMKIQRLKLVALSTAVMVGTLAGLPVVAEPTVNAVLQVEQAKTEAAQQSQKKIDSIADQTAELLQQFRTTNKQIEDLQVYNRQLQQQIDNQINVMAELEGAIEQVTVIERQVQPLILRMLDALEQFVELDAPFHQQERRERVAMLRRNQSRTDISVAEKFRQILEAYRIEAEYARKVDAYEDTIEIEGAEREVNILRVGRIALMYQTKDTKVSGVWNQRERKWEILDSGDYRKSILKGIRIAKQQASIELMELPIPAPEVAQ